MERATQLFADLRVGNIQDPEIQELLAQLRRSRLSPTPENDVVTEGDTIHLGLEYPGNDPEYTNWLFRVLSQLVSHTDSASLECLICDPSGDWWSERIYPAA